MKNSHRFTAVTFDAGNTLLYCDPSPTEIYARELSRLGRPVDADEVGPIFSQAWAEMQRRIAPGVDRYNSVSGGERAWWGGFVREVLARIEHEAPWEPLLENLYAAFERPDVWQPYPETRDTIAALSSQKIGLAVVSNWDRRLPEILENLDLTRSFDVITVSAIEGVEKPAPEIFHRTVSRLRVEPRSCLHVGDSPLEDYRGAESAGLTPVLVDRRGIFDNDSFRRIASLDEVLKMVQ